MKRRQKEADLGGLLERLLADSDLEARLDHDPLGLVRPYESRDDREVAGLIAALLAFGSVSVIRRNVRRVLDVLGERPAEGLDALDSRTIRRRLRGFRHRVYGEREVGDLLLNARRLRARNGSLGEALGEAIDAHDGELLDGLAVFADSLRGRNPSRAMAHLVPDPRAGSACKRLFLYLRWMVRPDDGIDLGVFQGIDPSKLLIPVDTHIHRICRNLGLTTHKAASLRAAIEITESLRRYDPLDPVRFDFALCHLGIARDCPSRSVPQICSQCVLQPACTIPLLSD